MRSLSRGDIAERSRRKRRRSLEGETISGSRVMLRWKSDNRHCEHQARIAIQDFFPSLEQESCSSHQRRSRRQNRGNVGLIEMITPVDSNRHTLGSISKNLSVNPVKRGNRTQERTPRMATDPTGNSDLRFGSPATLHSVTPSRLVCKHEIKSLRAFIGCVLNVRYLLPFRQCVPLLRFRSVPPNIINLHQDIQH